MTQNQVELCPRAQYSGQGHEWRVVCATGGGVLQQCEWCNRIEWSDGSDSFAAVRAAAEYIARKTSAE